MEDGSKNRWKCTQCQKFIKEEEFIGDNTEDLRIIAEKVAAEREGLKLPHFHSHTYGVGVGGGRIGFHMETMICGPVERVEVSSQVQFMEWLGLE